MNPQDQLYSLFPLQTPKMIQIRLSEKLNDSLIEVVRTSQTFSL